MSGQKLQFEANNDLFDPEQDLNKRKKRQQTFAKVVRNTTDTFAEMLSRTSRDKMKRKTKRSNVY